VFVHKCVCVCKHVVSIYALFHLQIIQGGAANDLSVSALQLCTCSPLIHTSTFVRATQTRYSFNFSACKS